MTNVYAVFEHVSTEEYGYTGGMVNIEHETIMSLWSSIEDAVKECDRLALSPMWGVRWYVKGLEVK